MSDGGKFNGMSVLIPIDRSSGNPVRKTMDEISSMDGVIDVVDAAPTLDKSVADFFPSIASYYVLARTDGSDISLENLSGLDKTKLAFKIATKDLFSRTGQDKTRYISLYYTKYATENSGLRDAAKIVARRDMVYRASLGEMIVLGPKPKFDFPYKNNMFILEVGGDATHIAQFSYCEKTRRNVSRCGVSLNNMISLSVM